MSDTHIRWRDEEVRQLADRFIMLRCADLCGDTLELFRKAMDVLPENRRRTLQSLNNVGPAVKLIASKVLFMTNPEDAAATAVAAYKKENPPLPSSLSQPAPEPPKPAPSPVQSGPIILEFRIPQASQPGNVEQIIANVPTPMLLGFALDRIMSGSPKGQLIETIRAVTQPFQTPSPQVPLRPEPVTITADSVQLPPGERRRVLVVGMLPDARRLAAEKSAGFKNVEVVFTDGTPQDGVIQCDYAILVQGLVTHFQAEQIRRRFVKDGSKRLITLEGGLDNLMRELNNINSKQ